MDRNKIGENLTDRKRRSLSARRAWIEMEYTLYCPPFGEVALRKESVDRNPYIPLAKVRHCVALRKESVDRNFLE